MAEVRLQSVTKTFGDLVAVDDVSLTVEDGELFVLLGPSGCGKTTTLRMVAGLESLDRGEIYIGEQMVNEYSARERDIALMFQLPTVYPHLSVEDNIAFPLKTQGVDDSLRDTRVRDTAEMLELAGDIHRRASKLSGGKKQAVALGRAMVRDPQVFLMDEPTTALDAKFRDNMQEKLKEMHRELGATIIYVTHDQYEALNLAEVVAVMDSGEIKQIDSPRTIYNDPDNLFVANFLGSPGMNLIETSLTEEGVINGDGFQLKLPQLEGNEVDSLAENSVIFGVRPENIEIRTSDPSNKTSGTILEGSIDLVKPVGRYTTLQIQVGQEIFQVQHGGEVDLGRGDTLYLDFSSSTVSLFDKQTGQSVII
ncbi:MAG: ABC transporter ATP-binding protein [Candidatus Bipolaricaulota bacterium]|nr:ABC transporter ATP-binding protein [Candidatus Bipolaricaulota bacterium]